MSDWSSDVCSSDLGDIADVDNAVTVASDSAGEKGLLVHRAVIPRPHDALWQQLMEG